MASINNNYNLINTFYSTSTNSKTSAYGSSKNDLMNTVLSQYGKNTAKGLSTGMQDYLSTLKSTSSSLKGIFSKSDLYNQKTIASSDNDVLSISSKSVASTKLNSLKDTTVNVDQIAAAQTNEGKALSSSLLTIGSGYKSMTITDANGKNHVFSLNSSVTSNNQKEQTALAEKINKSNIGVTAKVEVDSATKTSKLVLTSNKTGEASAFKASGDLADAMGVSSVTKQAQNAVYTVNGAKKTSQSNSVEINGISATLKAASEKAVTFTEKDDNTNLVNSAREMVNQYNKLMEAADENSDDSGAKRLLNSMQSLVKTYESSLKKSGISINENGYLEIDEEKMKKAAESGDLQKLTGKDNNANYGFASRLEQLATKISKDPSSFMSTSAKNLASQDSYYSFSNNRGASVAAFSTRLNSYYNTGMLFESMF